MRQATVCPELNQYQQLAAGTLSDADEDALLKHLERCDPCAQKLNTLAEQDTLVEFIRRGPARGDGAADEVIGRLVERLSKLRPSNASVVDAKIVPPRETAPVPPVTFACPSCGKGLKVKGALAGKKGKCPHCKDAVRVPPASAGAVSPEPRSQWEALTIAEVKIPSEAAASRTDQPHPTGDENKRPYDFLAPSQAPDELRRLGPYRVLQVLGAGGMGVVFQAEDPQLQRLVALKAMLPGLAASNLAKQRFLREARAAAAIKHDHIVTVHQVGEDRGVPYLAMEFLDGEPLDERLKREGKLPLGEVLRIGREMAEGLAAAHERGLIHRDIKPANVWLEGKRSRVKILDFGLARAATGEASLTQSGAIVGTPAYMAPEQAHGKNVDPRCDLFSLGCVLYRLATGKAPFRGADMISTLMAVATEDPKPPASLNRDLPTELSDFIMRLLAKEPGDRPPSALAAAEALEHIAAVDATSRAAPGQPARLSAPDLRTAPQRRNKLPIVAGLAGVAGLTACLLLGLVGLWSTGVFKLKTRDGTIVVENLPADAEVLVDGEKVALKLNGDGKPIEIQVAPGKRKLEIKMSGFKLETREVTLASGERKPIAIRLEPLAAASEKPAPPTPPTPPGTKDQGFVPLFNGKDLTGWTNEKGEAGNWKIVEGAITCSGPRDHFYTDRSDFGDFHLRAEVKINETGNSGIYFRAGKPLTLVGDYEAQICTRPDQQKTGSLYNLAPEKSILVGPNSWFTYEIIARGDQLKLLVNGKETANYKENRPKRRVVGHIALQHHDADTAVFFRKIEVRSLELPPAKPKPAPIKLAPSPLPSAALEALRRAQIAPEALKLAGDGDPNKAPASLVAVLGEVVPIHTGAVRGVAFSANGRWLASASEDKTILLRDATTGRVSRVLRGHTGPISSVTFSKDSRTLVSASHDGTLKLWSIEDEAEPETLRPNLGKIEGMAVSPDGRFLAAGGTNGTINLWEWRQWKKPIAISNGGSTVTVLAFSPDGELLAAGAEVSKAEAPIRLFKTADGKLAQTLPGHDNRVNALAFSRDGKYLASVGADPKAKVWDVVARKPFAEYVHNLGEGFTVIWTSAGQQLVLGVKYNGSPLLYDLLSRTATHLPVDLWPISLALSPDEKVLVTGAANGNVFWLDTKSWTQTRLQGGHRHYVTTVAFSPDGKTILSGGNDNTVRRWDLSRPGQNQIVADVANCVNLVAFGPEGKTFAAALRFKMILWDADTANERCTVSDPYVIHILASSTDGKTIAGSGLGHAVRLWDVDLGKEVHRFPPMGYVNSLGFSADGLTLAAASFEKNWVKVWNVASGVEIGGFQGGFQGTTRFIAQGAAFSPDGRRLAAGHEDGTITLWDVAKGKKQRTLRGHTARVTSLKFTHDGKSLFSSGDDGTIRAWDPEAERAREVIPLGPANQPLAFDLDQSGRYLVAAGRSPVIYVLRLPLGDSPSGTEKTTPTTGQ